MSKSKTATAWGVIDHNGINIRTVSDTRRAAIVNWLVVEANQMIFGDQTDDNINAMWDACRGEAIASPVVISYVQRS